MSKEEILAYFYSTTVFTRTKARWKAPFDPSRYRGHKLGHDLVDAKTGKVRAEAGDKLSPRAARKLAEEGLKEIQVGQEDLVGHYLAVDVINEKTGEIFAEAGDEVTEPLLGAIEEAADQRAAGARARSSRQAGPISATRCRSTRTRRARTRSSTSTASCARASRRRSRPPRRCSTACSSTPSAMISRPSAASR